MLKLVIEGNNLSELRAHLREVSIGLGNGSQIVPEQDQHDEPDAPQTEPAKKRGRPAKTDTPAVEDKKPEPTPEPEQPKATALTEKECREAAKNALEAGAAEDIVRGLFGKFGANRVSELKPEIYADFIAACGVEAEKAKSSAALMD